MHYGDRVPAKYMNQERSVLNEQGVVVKKQGALKTEEELREEQRNKKRLAEEEKRKLIEAKRNALRDRVLLETFTSERDIIIARDARVDAVDTQILLTETIIKDNEKKLESLKSRIAGIEKSGRTVPENLHKEQASVSRQLETHYQFVETKNNERQQIMDKFDGDIKRFRELMEAKKQKKSQRQ